MLGLQQWSRLPFLFNNNRDFILLLEVFFELCHPGTYSYSFNEIINLIGCCTFWTIWSSECVIRTFVNLEDDSLADGALVCAIQIKFCIKWYAYRFISLVPCIIYLFQLLQMIGSIKINSSLLLVFKLSANVFFIMREITFFKWEIVIKVRDTKTLRIIIGCLLCPSEVDVSFRVFIEIQNLLISFFIEKSQLLVWYETSLLECKRSVGIIIFFNECPIITVREHFYQQTQNVNVISRVQADWNKPTDPCFMLITFSIEVESHMIAEYIALSEKI